MFAQPVNCPKAGALQALSKELKDNDGHTVTHVFHLAFHGESGRPLVLCLMLWFAQEILSPASSTSQQSDWQACY
jgi:hypothetical protein